MYFLEQYRIKGSKVW